MFIKATGDKSAEMVTDEGAIYVTSNKGYNWKAAIQETVSATLNRFITLLFGLYWGIGIVFRFQIQYIFNRDQSRDSNFYSFPWSFRTVSSGISGASYYTGTFSAVNRSPDGRYVAVSSRGNFFLTWEPGQVSLN